MVGQTLSKSMQRAHVKAVLVKYDVKDRYNNQYNKKYFVSCFYLSLKTPKNSLKEHLLLKQFHFYSRQNIPYVFSDYLRRCISFNFQQNSTRILNKYLGTLFGISNAVRSGH